MLRVNGYPPTKNEAKSLLSDGHGQFGRVRLLLEEAAKAVANGAQPLGAARLGMELVVCGSHRTESRPANYLGGVGDVLQDKGGRLFAHDRQIREVSYREQRAAEPRYRLRIWPLDLEGK